MSLTIIEPPLKPLAVRPKVAAQTLGVTHAKCRELILTRELPSFLAGKRLRLVAVSDIEDFLAKPKHEKQLPMRAQVWDKTDGHCWYCRKRLNPFHGFHVDHFMPQSLGGSNSIDNLVPACAECNIAKGATHPDKWLGESFAVTFTEQELSRCPHRRSGTAQVVAG